MASLIKIGSHYYVQFYDRTRTPARKQVPLRTTTKAVAIKAARALEDRLALGTFDPWAPKPDTPPPTEHIPETPKRIPTLGEAATAFLTAKSHLREASVRNYRERLTLLLRHLGEDRRPESVKEADVRAFLSHGNTSDTTKRNYLRHLRVFFRWLVERGDLAVDPTSKIKLRKAPSKFAKYLMPGDLDHLCQTIREDGESLWFWPMVELTAHLGLRRNEVLNLQWGDVDFLRGTVSVSNSKTFTTKSGHERELPMSRRAVEILTELRAQDERDGYVFTLRKGRISGSYVTHRFVYFRRMAGLPEYITFHSLRHTAASWLVMNGASLEAVRMFLGHSDIQVTQRYAHLAPSVYHSQVTDALNR